MNKKTKEKIKKAPSTPGVYFFYNDQGEVVYTGKASNLKKRLNSYLHKTTSKNPYKIKLFREIQNLNWKKTDNEAEALITESRYIKKLQPKYNILMRDDKNYFYLSITSERFPKINITHQPPKERRAIGPFTNGNALRESLKTLRKIFPYCSCNKEHKNPCTNYFLKIDPGYCCSRKLREKFQKEGKDIEKEYKENIDNILTVLTGKRGEVLKKIEKKMKEEAKKQNFEQAAKLRDKLQSLQKVLEHKKIISRNLIKDSLWQKIGLKKAPRKIEAYDVSNIQGKLATASLVAYTRSKDADLGLQASSYQPKKSQYRHFKIKTVKQANDPAMLEETLERRAQHQEWTMPDLIIADGGKTQLRAFKKAKEKSGLKSPLMAFAKQNNIIYTEKEEKLYLKKLAQPLRLLLKNIMEEAHRFAINYHKKLRNQNVKK